MEKVLEAASSEYCEKYRETSLTRLTVILLCSDRDSDGGAHTLPLLHIPGRDSSYLAAQYSLLTLQAGLDKSPAALPDFSWLSTRNLSVFVR